MIVPCSGWQLDERGHVLPCPYNGRAERHYSNLCLRCESAWVASPQYLEEQGEPPADTLSDLEQHWAEAILGAIEGRHG